MFTVSKYAVVPGLIVKSPFIAVAPPKVKARAAVIRGFKYKLLYVGTFEIVAVAFAL